jgi:hypothetical protein
VLRKVRQTHNQSEFNNHGFFAQVGLSGKKETNCFQKAVGIQQQNLAQRLSEGLVALHKVRIVCNRSASGI